MLQYFHIFYGLYPGQEGPEGIRTPQYGIWLQSAPPPPEKKTFPHNFCKLHPPSIKISPTPLVVPPDMDTV